MAKLPRPDEPAFVRGPSASADFAPPPGGGAARRPAQRRRGGVFAWVLLVAVCVAGGMGVVLVLWPLQARLQATEDALAEATASAAALQNQLQAATAALHAQQEVLAEGAQAQAAHERSQASQAHLEEQLAQALAAQVSAGTAAIVRGPHALRIELGDGVLFAGGGNALSPGGNALLASLAAVLRALPDQEIEVRGHVGRTPPPPPPRRGRAAPAPFNVWEASWGHGLAVVTFLQEACQIPGGRLVAAARGDYHAATALRPPAQPPEAGHVEWVLPLPAAAPEAPER